MMTKVEVAPIEKQPSENSKSQSSEEVFPEIDNKDLKVPENDAPQKEEDSFISEDDY